MMARRSFENEIGNQIAIEVLPSWGHDFDPVRIIVTGPLTLSENLLTRREAEELRDALVEALT